MPFLRDLERTNDLRIRKSFSRRGFCWRILPWVVVFQYTDHSAVDKLERSLKAAIVVRSLKWQKIRIWYRMLQFQRRFRIFYTGTMHGQRKAEHQTKNINNKGQVKATVKGFSDRQASPYQFTSGTCTLHMSTPNYDAKLARNLTRSLVWPPGGTPRKRWWGCVTGYPSPLSYFTYTIYRLTKNAIPYLRPDRPFNQTLFQIRLKINVYILLLGTILRPLPKTTYPIQD